MSVNFSDNYFALFDLPPAMSVDREQLDSRYKALQRELHPDRFVNASDSERRWSMQATSLVNQARQTLLDPLARAIYLLSLSGIDIDAETDTRMSGDFLMTQMTLRESLEDARASANPFEEFDGLRRTVHEMSKEIETAFETAFEAGNLAEARDRAREWQFLYKLKAEVDEVESELDEY
ncbi:MAG: Fe-S protein assembly co-chaperone HscB [Gammaproteobacteria bacterium]|nr:Fe-S protein assembly co-chaperone HscB [Gammaproteobacteria bacterium]